MSFVAAYADVVTALEAAGLRVAQRDGDITPPIVYVGRGTLTDAGAPLAGGRILGAYLYYIPVRGVDNMTGDLEALDTIYDALTPIAWAPLNATWSHGDGPERDLAVVAYRHVRRFCEHSRPERLIDAYDR